MDEVKGRGAVERSARRCEALLADIFSAPRSERRDRIIDCKSKEEMRGAEQNVQGPRPSFTQIILPQLRQLGAARSNGWRVARQLQRRADGSDWERAGLVCTSRVRIAESKSARVVEAPCMDEPPEMEMVVLGAGDEFLEGCLELGREVVLTLGRSEMRGPEAGGGLEVLGSWRVVGCGSSDGVLARIGCF